MYPSRVSLPRTSGRKLHRRQAMKHRDMLAKLASLDARPIAPAGGQTLIPMMKLRLVSRAIWSISAASRQRRTCRGGETIEIGALARHQDIGKFAVAARYPILKDCALGIADVQVRNMGTIGGSLAEADPNAAAGRRCWSRSTRRCCVSQGGTRDSVRELLADAYTPNLGAGELITRILIDRAALSGFGTFVAFKRAAPAYPTASCALYVEGDVSPRASASAASR